MPTLQSLLNYGTIMSALNQRLKDREGCVYEQRSSVIADRGTARRAVSYNLVNTAAHVAQLYDNPI